MKRLLVFFIAIVVNLLFLCVPTTHKNFAAAKDSQMIIDYKAHRFVLDLSSNAQSKMRTSINNLNATRQLEYIQKIVSMGFTVEQALYYVFPNLQQSINNICNKLLITAQEPSVFADDNNCKIIFKNAKNGVKVDKNQLICDFYENLKSGKKINLKLDEIYAQTSLENLQKQFVKVAEFSTSFLHSSAARKSNISLACSAINGKFIKSGEVFSFNAATGLRTTEKGYQSAKIIENGSYVDGIGGGVCQVSTTLYNACMLAGLTATEVHNHSLLSSYVDPAFDAMVSSGTSDLKIKNNSKNHFLITTSSNQEICKVCIYGVKPKYQIRTRFCKYEDLPAKEDIVETDAGKYGGAYGEGVHRICYGADGCRVKGYLDYYDNDVLVKSELVRDCTYSPKQGIVLSI